MYEILGQIRREGNAEINQLLKTLGQPIQPVRITKSKDPLPTVPCPNCGAYYNKRTLSRHFKVCSGKPVKKNFSSVVEDKQKLKNAKNIFKMSEEIKNIIIPGMRTSQKDSVVDDIINDEDLIAMGNSLCIKFGHELEHQKKLIRRRLRAMASLRVVMAKEDPSVACVRDIFDTDKWGSYINAVQELAKLKSSEESRISPNIVNEIGLLATNVARNVKVSQPKTATGDTVKNTLNTGSQNTKYNSVVPSDIKLENLRKERNGKKESMNP